MILVALAILAALFGLYALWRWPDMTEDSTEDL